MFSVYLFFMIFRPARFFYLYTRYGFCFCNSENQLVICKIFIHVATEEVDQFLDTHTYSQFNLQYTLKYYLFPYVQCSTGTNTVVSNQRPI